MKYYFPIFLLIFTFSISSQTLDPVLSLRLLILNGFIFSIFISLIITKKEIIPKSINHPITYILTFQLLVNIVTSINSINLYESIYEIFKLVSLLLIFIIILKYISLIKNKSTLYRSLVFIGIINCTIGISQYYFNFPILSGADGNSSTFSNRNLYSSAIYLIIPFYLITINSETRKFKWIGIIGLILSLQLILLIQTRAVWVALIVSGIILLIHKLKSISIFNFKLTNTLYKNIKTPHIIMSIFVVVIILFPAQRSIGLTHLADRLTSIVDFNFKSVQERFDLWEGTINMIKDHPILGVGPGNWRINFPQYTPDSLFRNMGYISFNRPHNDYLWVTAETGLIGFFIYLILFSFLFYSLLKILKDKSIKDKEQFFYLFLGLIGYLTISFFSYPKERIFHSVILMINTAIIVDASYPYFHKKLKINLFKKSKFIILMISFIGMIYSFNRFKMDQTAKTLWENRQAGNWEQIVNEFEEFDSKYYSLDPKGFPFQWLAGVAEYSLGNSDHAETQFEMGLKLNPNNPHVINNLATVKMNLGKEEEGISLYTKAVNMMPRFMDARLNLATIYYNKGSHEKAYQLLTEVPRWFKNVEQESRYYELMNVLNP